MIFGMDNNKPYINTSITSTYYKLLASREAHKFSPNNSLYFSLRDMSLPEGFNGTSLDRTRWIYKEVIKDWILSSNLQKCLDYVMKTPGYWIVPNFGDCSHHYAWWGISYNGCGMSVLRECPNKPNHYFVVQFYFKLPTSVRDSWGREDLEGRIVVNMLFIKVAEDTNAKFKDILTTYYTNRSKTIETLDKDYVDYDMGLRFQSYSDFFNPRLFFSDGINKYMPQGTKIQDKMSFKAYYGYTNSVAYRHIYVVSMPSYFYNVFNPMSLTTAQWNSIYTSSNIIDQSNYLNSRSYIFDDNNPIRYGGSGLEIYINQLMSRKINEVTDANFIDVFSNVGASLDIRTNESVLTTSNSPVQEHTDLSIWTNDTIKADVVTNSSTAVLRKTTGPRDTEGNASSLWLSSPKVELQVNNKYLIKKLSNQYQTNITLNNIEYISPVNNKKYVLSIYYQVLSNNNMATMTILSKTEVTN